MQELYQLEQFSRDSFRVKRTYIDAADDLVAGLLLGQVVYWNLPNEKGKSKLRVKKKDEYWLAKGRNDWWDEIRITPKQFDRAIKILKDKGFVETQNFKFNGSPTVHIKLNVSEVTEKVSSLLTTGENGNSPKVKKEVDQEGISLTEITSETTSKTKDNIYSYADFVKMKESEYNKLIEQFGERGTKERIENLNLYKGSTGKKYKSDYLTILNWERKNKGSAKPNGQYKEFTQYDTLF
jgi:hypothetical protein